MSKRSTTQVGRQMEMLPLEEWIKAERTRSNACRSIGELAATIVERAGRPHTEGGGGTAKPALARDGEVSPRIETGGKRALPEGRAVALAGAISSLGEAVDHFLPNTMLDRRPNTSGMVAVVYVFERMASEPEHQTDSGSETWIEF